MRRTAFSSSIMLAFAACVAAYVAICVGVRDRLEPKLGARYFSRISHDGWIQTGSRLKFHRLSSRGNRIDLRFDPSRPGTTERARLRARVCGAVVSEFEVSEAEQRLFLRGDCEPREVEFEVLNPVVASADDRRALGARLVEVRLSSRLGVPLVSPWAAWPFMGAVALLACVVWWMSGSVIGSLVITGCSAALIAMHPQSVANLRALWILVAALTLGLGLGARLGWRALECGRGGRFISRDAVGIWSVLAVVAVLLGGALRFYGIDFGLPHNYHPDEVPKINAIMRMVDNGDLNPRYFLHPTLLLYLTYGMNSFLHLFGFVEGGFRESAFLAGRLVSALAGTASIFLLYSIGRSLFAPVVGVIAAFLVAVFPLHVTCSRYLKEDALLLFFMLGAVAAMAKSVRERNGRWLLVAGACAGLASTTKYSGLMALLFVGIAPWLSSRSLIPDRRLIPWVIAGCCLAPVAFVLGTPYSVLDFDHFSRGVMSEKVHMLKGHTESITAWSQLWMYHFSRSVLPGVHPLVAVLSVIAAGVLLWRRRVEDLFVVGMILFFYLPAEMVRSKPAPQPERYIFPCLPFIALALGELCRIVWYSRWRALSFVLTGVAVMLPLVRSIQLASELPRDTRAQAAAWMVENLPAGSRIYLDWEPYAPKFFKGEFEVVNDTKKLIMQYLDVSQLRRSGVEYMVLSSLAYERFFTQPNRKYARMRLYDHVFEKVPVLKEFAPHYGTYGFHNPVVTVFSLKEEDFARLDEERARKARGEIDATSNDLRALMRWRIVEAGF